MELCFPLDENGIELCVYEGAGSRHIINTHCHIIIVCKCHFEILWCVCNKFESLFDKLMPFTYVHGEIQQ